MNNDKEIYQHWSCEKLLPLQLIFPTSKLGNFSDIDFAYSMHRRECSNSHCVVIHLGLSLDGKNILQEDDIESIF